MTTAGRSTRLSDAATRLHDMALEYQSAGSSDPQRAELGWSTAVVARGSSVERLLDRYRSMDVGTLAVGSLRARSMDWAVVTDGLGWRGQAWTAVVRRRLVFNAWIGEPLGAPASGLHFMAQPHHLDHLAEAAVLGALDPTLEGAALVQWRMGPDALALAVDALPLWLETLFDRAIGSEPTGEVVPWDEPPLSVARNGDRVVFHYERPGREPFAGHLSLQQFISDLSAAARDLHGALRARDPRSTAHPGLRWLELAVSGR
jgi:hypothetical protein